MRSRSFIILLAIAGLVGGFLVVTAQQPDDDVRGAFLSTRPKTTSLSATRRRRPPRRPNINASSTVTMNANAGMSHMTVPANTNSSVANAAQAIGLGYTLFMRDATGHGVSVEPGHEFHNGDRVRISLEPNVDGFLYVFHTEGNGPAEMIFPDPRLDGGENWIAAHVPLEVPSSEQTDERLRWFTFYGNPGTERLYLVVTRDPLPIVPTGAELVKFCSEGKDKCPWHPATEVWVKVQDGSKAEVKIVTSSTFGQAQTQKEQVATTRGLGLDQSAPQPSVIRINTTSSAPVLVTILDLIHK